MKTLEGALHVKDGRMAVIVSRFNSYLTDHMLKGALSAYERLGGHPDQLTVAHVPGSFELPVTALKLAETGDYGAVICLGCVIRG